MKSSYRSAKANRPRKAGQAGSSGPREMRPAVRPSANSSSDRQGRRRQRLTKKTDAILRMRIIMVHQIYTVQSQAGNRPDERLLTGLPRKIAPVAAEHGFARGDLGIERVEVLRTADATQRVPAGRDQIAPAGRIE